MSELGSTEGADGDGADDDGAEHRGADRAFLGLAPSGERARSFLVRGALARHDGRLYGGTALAAAIALMEEATGRRALWSTVQFTSGAAVVGDQVDCEVEVLASGRRASQVRVTARARGQEIFCALGAAAIPKATSVTGVFEEPPVVLEPELCEEFRFPVPPSMRRDDVGIERSMEIRIARHPDGRPPRPGELRFWMRVPGHRATPAMLGYLADMVPMSVVHAAGHMGGGTSLDNTLRLGQPADTEWVLLALDPHLALGGYGHGTGHLWSPDGRLLATASQTASLLVLD